MRQGKIMTKLKKVFYSIWAGLTLVLALFGWWQTQRLNTVSTERDRIQYTSLRTLLDESQRMLDIAARQVTGSPNERTQATSSVATSLTLLDAASKSADTRTATDIRTEWDALSNLRSEVASSDPGAEVGETLRKEADKVRKITQDFITRQ